ncbi:unnamed protein product [Protopolystoma xenopodis]|uniref:Uncharacterized protein n=1 Tax=Protopolystoma xenopodis TaxID=117903 RepID=A0A3S5CNC9_9PLAT|nr:unnamed protein product [Protopolystoma xenopodis]
MTVPVATAHFLMTQSETPLELGAQTAPNDFSLLPDLSFPPQTNLAFQLPRPESNSGQVGPGRGVG